MYCKTLNFTRDLFSLILQVMKICKTKYLWKFKFYTDSNSKISRFAKLSTYKNGSNLQLVKWRPRKINVFYSTCLAIKSRDFPEFHQYDILAN